MWGGGLMLILLFGLCVCFSVVGSVLLLLLLRRRRRLDETSVLSRVVGAAARALHPQHVERHRAMSLAVVTDYFDGGTLVLGGHRRVGDLLVDQVPVVLHVPGGVHAQRAAVRSCSDHVIEAGLV